MYCEAQANTITLHSHSKAGKTLRNKVSIGEYLAFLSTKHQVDPDKFFQALTLAEQNQEATCGELAIKCRARNQDKITILILQGQKVVAQMPISREFLQDQRNPIRDLMKTRFASRNAPRNSADSLLHIKDLRYGMKQVSLKAKILELPEPKLVYTRFGNCSTVSNATIMDETGTIKLCLWNEQITSVATGDVVQIENASMSRFKGENQLKIGRKGKVSSLKQSNAELEIRSS
ncbi:MAG TPA: hypothetical protein VMT01_03825 [Candidatus Acidoferrum sp.]|nr:hypothetical protein [Candidatus Acidoferrum sp.]